jgi:hypothetical protein
MSVQSHSKSFTDSIEVNVEVNVGESVEEVSGKILEAILQHNTITIPERSGPKPSIRCGSILTTKFPAGMLCY